jgi:protein-S-isoprenylcysteine O-methyltransferase Ste14
LSCGELEEDMMHVLDHRVLGIGILALLAMLVVVKRVRTGSVLDRPTGPLLVQLVNAFNLVFLLVVNPLAALALILRRVEAADPTHVVIGPPGLVIALELAGLALYALGFLLMAWALISLGRSYQLGGSAPRTGDAMVVSGPYRLVRHPMYTAALSIAPGLAFLTQSAACLGVFCTYLVLILLLIPAEERGLQRAYGERYVAYQRETGKLLPSVRGLLRPGAWKGDSTCTS